MTNISRTSSHWFAIMKNHVNWQHKNETETTKRQKTETNCISGPPWLFFFKKLKISIFFSRLEKTGWKNWLEIQVLGTEVTCRPHEKIFYRKKKFRFLDKTLIFRQNFNFWEAFSIFAKTFRSWEKFRSLEKFRFLGQFFIFRQNFDFLRIISISGAQLQFLWSISFLGTIQIFGHNFRFFWAQISTFVQNFHFLGTISIFSQYFRSKFLFFVNISIYGQNFYFLMAKFSQIFRTFRILIIFVGLIKRNKNSDKVKETCFLGNVFGHFLLFYLLLLRFLAKVIKY